MRSKCNTFIYKMGKRRSREVLPKAGEGVIKPDLTQFSVIMGTALEASLTVQWLRHCLPRLQVPIQSLVGDLKSHMPCDQGQQQQQKIQTVKQKQYCNKFNQDFKNSPHQKTNKQTQCRTCKILGSMLQMGKLRLGATKWPHQALLLGGAELPHHRPSCLFCSCHRTEDHSQLFPSSDLGCCSTLP